MASVGHIAIGLVGSRWLQAMRNETRHRVVAGILMSALSMLPDVDVGGFALGVRYDDPWGHRGATHSIVFALAVGLLVSFFARKLKVSQARLFAFAAGVVMSHGLLDTLTDGGLGCALFWPFSNVRYFAPWRPIPVAPIGLGFLSARGLRVALTELAIFAIPLLYGIWPTRVKRSSAVDRMA